MPKLTLEDIARAEEMESIFKKYFPEGYYHASKGCFGGAGFFVRVGLIKNQADCFNNIRENDPMGGLFFVEGYTLECTHGVRLWCKAKEKHFAMSHLKINFRKFTAKDNNHFLERWEKFVKGAQETVKAQKEANNIYEQDRIGAQYLSLEGGTL